MKFYSSLLFVFFISVLSIQAQQLSLDDQFDDLIKKSNNYQDYKVVKKDKIYLLRKNVSDSIISLEGNISSLSSEIVRQKSEVNNLTSELENTKSELTISQGKENGINVLGIMTNKSTYTLIVFITLGVLLLIIIILFIKYKNGFDLIKTTKSKLAETDEEFENFRQRSLEREQQIRRKLQDEINKNKA